MYVSFQSIKHIIIVMINKNMVHAYKAELKYIVYIKCDDKKLAIRIEHKE